MASIKGSTLTSITLTLLLLFASNSIYSKACYDYNNTKDPLKGKIVIDDKLYSKFFDSHETSYPWYIYQRDDGTFEETSTYNEETTTNTFKIEGFIKPVIKNAL